MENICEKCRYWTACAVNDEVGDCHCMASKYYGDIMQLTETCQCFELFKEKITIDVARCKGCSLCVSECTGKNIRMSNDLNKSGTNYAEVISQRDCTGCALCCRICPDLAIGIKE